MRKKFAQIFVRFRFVRNMRPFMFHYLTRERLLQNAKDKECRGVPGKELISE